MTNNQELTWGCDLDVPVTVIRWEDSGQRSTWRVIKGDKRHWSEVFINQDGCEDIQDEMLRESYEENGEGYFKLQVITAELAQHFVNRGAYLIACGFLS